MTLASENRFPLVRILEDPDPPDLPPAGEVHLKVDEATKLLYQVDDTGAITTFGPAGYVPGGTDVAVADGGTGASTAAAARTNLSVPAIADLTAVDADLTALETIALIDPILLSEAAAPGTPASGKVRVYAKTDGRIYSKDDAGAEFGPFDAAGGGGGGSGYIAAVTGETGITEYWPLNDGIGATTYVDAVGSNDMTALGTTPGFGPPLQKDPAGGSLCIPTQLFRVGRAAMAWGAAYTMEAWVILNLGDAGFYNIIGQWDGSGSMLAVNNASELRAYCGAGYASWTTTDAVLAGLHHIAATHDGTDVRLYWDGVLKATSTQTLPSGSVGSSWRVGAYSGSSSGGRMVVSDVALYRGAALSAATLLAHHALGA